MRFLVCSVSLLIASAVLRAQSVPFPQPTLITDRQGLPQAFVPAILQNKQGFIWVATRDGLCRYDGYRFKVFQPDPDGRTSLSFAGLNQIELDQHGRIWIVSERGDIDVFDPRTETFTNFSRQAAFRRLVKPGTTYSIYIDRKDRLWLTVTGFVIFWDLAKKQGHWFHHQPQQTASISDDGVYGLPEGADGTIWLVTAYVRSMMRGENALQPQIVQLMQTDVSAANKGYGLGTNFRQNLGYGHAGAIAGYLSHMAYDPATGVSIVAMLPLIDWRQGNALLNACIGAMLDAAYAARQSLGYPGKP